MGYWTIKFNVRQNGFAPLLGCLEAVTDTLEKGENVTLIGFGTFSAVKRTARTGRNPQTGKAIKIPAKTVVKFKPGKKLADAVK